MIISLLFIGNSAFSQQSIEGLDLENLNESDCSFLDSTLNADPTIPDWQRKEYYAYMQMAHESRGHYQLALYCADSLLALRQASNDSLLIAESYRDISLLYDYIGDYPSALDYSLKGLELFKELGNQEGIASSYNDIGVLHYYEGDLEEARKNYESSLVIFKKLEDTAGIAMYYNNMANTLYDEDQLDLALEMYQKALKYDKQLKDQGGQCVTMNNIGEVYTAKGEYDTAEEILLETLALSERIDDKWAQTNPLNALGDLYQKTGELHKAILVLEKGVKICKEIDALPEQSENYRSLYELHKQQRNFETALHYYELYNELDDSLFNVEKERVMTEMQAKYDLQDKAKEIELITQEKKISDMQFEQKISKQQNRQFYLIIGLVGFAIILGFVIRVVILKKKANEQLVAQNLIIQNKNEQIQSAFEQIEEKNKEILDSIRYAKRIQSAILPSKATIETHLPESFVLYIPKDVVAGDFYWLEKKEDEVLIAAADCTGHGVPGAMVSVVCNNGLNRSVREHGLTDPGKILDKTRKIVLQEFEKSEEEVKDGMDIALVNMKRVGDQVQLHYAGAHNPLWIIRNGSSEIEEIKADKQPIGDYMKQTPFQTHFLTLQSGDTFYLFSDGYADQFGGEKGKKMKSGNFKKLLHSLRNKSMIEQESRLQNAFEEWKGEIEQLDDVCVIGVRI